MYLGINAFVHDASAAIVGEDGKIIAAVEEERFTRKKQESRFPIESIKYCLKAAGITINELDGIGFGWSPKLFLFLYSVIAKTPKPSNLGEMLPLLAAFRTVDWMKMGLEIREMSLL